MSPKAQVGVAGVMVVAAVAAVWWSGAREPTPQEAAEGVMQEHDHAAMVAGTGDAGPVRLSEEGARRIGVTFALAEERALTRTIATVGRVTYDETRLVSVTPKVDGWVDRLYVDFTGAPVRRGQRLLDLYSPSLVAAQEELILASRLAASSTGRAAEGALDLLASARRRLAYWDIGEEDIRAVEEGGEVVRTLALRSPGQGVVVEKSVTEGARVGPSTTLYRIADLSRVWVEADVFEKDLALVREGLEAVITLEAFPGEVFVGRVTYVYPTVSMESRTGSIRVELDNPGLRLKPGMYANIRLTSPPRAPRVVVPRSALLETGARTLVFVVAPGGTLTPRAVATGFASGDEVEILRGLTAGEYVVSSAGFLIDAESNLGSAMADMESDPQAGMPPPGDPGG